METVVVEVIIPVHNLARPVDRAVSSVLENTKAAIKVTIVAHNIGATLIREKLGKFAESKKVRVIEYSDGLFSPSGPKNFAFAKTEAKYVLFLDSDDTLEAGAIDEWLSAAQTLPGGAADVVIAPSVYDNQNFSPSPPIRKFRSIRRKYGKLDPVKDRLFYRAAHVGLINTATFSNLRFTENVPTGEDQIFSAKLWTKKGAKIIFAFDTAGYREHDDQTDRVTGTTRPVSKDFLFLPELLNTSNTWIKNDKQRLSLVAKIIRVHLFDSLKNRLPHEWNEENARQMAEIAVSLENTSREAIGLLSMADARLFEAIKNPKTNPQILEKMLLSRAKLRSMHALIPKHLAKIFDRNAPIRFHVAGVLLKKKRARILGSSIKHSSDVSKNVRVSR